MFSSFTKVIKRISDGGTDDSQHEAGASGSDSDSSNSFGKTISYGVSGIMSKIKIGVFSSTPTAEPNPITKYFEIRKLACNIGTGQLWQVHDACRLSDGRECSVFFFDKRIAEKYYRPKRKEALLERIKWCISYLDRLRHPRMLQILHGVEEGTYTIAFASEAIIGTLQNILSWHQAHDEPGLPPPIMPYPPTFGPSPAPGLQAPPPNNNGVDPRLELKEYHFLDFELRYGFIQIIEALQCMHYQLNQVHRNVCPQSIIVTKKGTWKLFGFELSEPTNKKDPSGVLPVAPWSMKVGQLSQPNLDYLAPEVQINGECSILSDMFSLGLVMCTLFNNGNALIQANNNPIIYMKQMEYLEQQVYRVLPRIPDALKEAVQRLVTRDPHSRPTTQLLPLISYFKSSLEPAIVALQTLETITMKSIPMKSDFYRNQLIAALPFIPKKLRWQHVWHGLYIEVRIGEVLEDVIMPIIWLTSDASQDEFSLLVLPTVKEVFKTSRDQLNSPKSCKAAVIILENLQVFLKKCRKSEINRDVMPMLYSVLETDHKRLTFEMLLASLIAMQNVAIHIEDSTLRTFALNRARYLVDSYPGDVKITNMSLCFYEKILLRLDRNHVFEDVIPALLAMRLSDPDIMTRIVKLYKTMLFERKLGITSTLMASRLIPALVPQTINPALNVEQFNLLIEILYNMLESIDQVQRRKLKEGGGQNSPERQRMQRYLENTNPPPFSIPNLRVDRRKTSSAEDMGRKNPVTAPTPTGSVGGFKGTGFGQWLFGLNNSSNNEGNFLRVTNIFTNRRLSDNALLTPKINIASSSTSSPGGTPGGSATGLPPRRHSSFGPQERRCSAVNLSPSTGNQNRGRTGGSGSSLSVPSTSHSVGGQRPHSSSSVPHLLTSSMQSVRGRRKSSGPGGSQGSRTSLLQQISSGVVRNLPGKSSSTLHPQLASRWSALQGATSAGYTALQNTAMAVRKFPSLNIKFTR